MNAADKKPFEKNLDDIVDFYKDDLDKFQQETQLSLLLVEFSRENGKINLEDIIKYLSRPNQCTEDVYVPGDKCHKVALGHPSNQCCK